VRREAGAHAGADANANANADADADADAGSATVNAAAARAAKSDSTRAAGFASGEKAATKSMRALEKKSATTGHSRVDVVTVVRVRSNRFPISRPGRMLA
jgi:hypothetical protein